MMAGTCRPSPINLLLLFVTSTYGAPWSKLMPAAIDFPSAVTMNMIPQLRNKLSLENCTTNGKFAIPESCETFYQCDDWDGLAMEMYQFTCPVGTIFDDQVSTCTFPSLVKSRPNCASREVQGNTVKAINFGIGSAGYEMESVPLAAGNDYAVRHLIMNTIQDRTKRSAIIEEDYGNEENNVTEETEDILDEYDITAECKGNITEYIIEEEERNITDSDLVAESALQSCRQIYYVDEYVDMVTSMIPVIFPDYLRAVFQSDAIDEYNSVLEAAQNHTYIWRHGENIMSGFRRTFELAKLFGPSFQRKYGIAQSRLQIVTNSEETLKLENETREDIKNIKMDINNYMTILKENPSLMTIFQPMITEKEAQLADKREKLRNIMSKVKDLDLLINFLKSVRNDAGAIKERADLTKAKLLIFRSNTLKDKKAFIRSKKHAESAIEQATQKVNKTIQEIESFKERKKKKEELYDQYKQFIDETEDNIDKELLEMKNFIQKMNSDMAEESRRGAFSRFWRILFGGKHVSHLPDALKRNREQLHYSINIYNDRINRTEVHLNQAAQEVYDLEEKIIKSGTELRNLGFVDYYMMMVIEESDKILPYITRAIYGLDKLTNTFENIVFNLESLINKAKEVQEPAEKRDFANLVFVDMSTMQTDWNNSYSDIIDIGSCTDPDYYKALVEIIRTIEPLNITTSIIEPNCTSVVEPLPINYTTTIMTSTTPLPFIEFDSDFQNLI